MPIPDELIERVRDAADIVEVIGEQVELKRSGTDYRGPCPFHGGTHRNFAVIPKKQMFYCFVCHEAGDVFTYLMKRLGLDYPSAVRQVAGRYGIVIPERPVGGPDPREPLFTAAATAAEWYARRLIDADDARPARDYVVSRGFPLESLAPWGLGFAPKGAEFLEFMESLGVAAEVLIEAGLAVHREDGSLRPRFWGRLLFPIHDLRGRVVAFGGRLLGDGEPKYLNSPDTPIFHKGSLLYNLHQAKHAIRKAERVVIVEGYFDAIRMSDVGVEEVVAPLGTSLTTDQARLVRRYANTAVLLYDSDRAGLKATFRAADVLLAAGMRVLVATPPAGSDPDDLAREGGRDTVEALLADAIDVFERKIQLLERKGWMADLSGRRRALDRLIPTLRAASDGVTRELYVTRAAEALGVPRHSVEQELSGRDHRRAPAHDSLAGEAQGDRGAAGRSGPERELVRVLVHVPEWRPRVAEHLTGPELPPSPERTLLQVLLRAAVETSGSDLMLQVDGEARALLARTLEESWGPPDVDGIVDGALRRIESRALKARVQEIRREMTVASEERKMELANELNRVAREKDKLSPDWKVTRRARSP
ncbi:MAG TPA: DNA primase [Gemmatimonadales bacterium]|jgi:DNA primase